MDQKDLLSAAAADLRSALPILRQSDRRLREQIDAALGHLAAERVDAFAAREVLQGVERALLQSESLPPGGESDRLLHLVRAADQKLTAALSAGHYSEG